MTATVHIPELERDVARRGGLDLQGAVEEPGPHKAPRHKPCGTLSGSPTAVASDCFPRYLAECALPAAGVQWVFGSGLIRPVLGVSCSAGSLEVRLPVTRAEHQAIWG